MMNWHKYYQTTSEKYIYYDVSKNKFILENFLNRKGYTDVHWFNGEKIIYEFFYVGEL